MASIGTRKGIEKAQGGIRRGSIKDGEIIGPKLHPDVLSKAYFRYEGKGQPALFAATMAGFAAGTDAVENVAVLPGCGVHLHYTPKGVITTSPLGPTADADGLDLSLDLTDTEGVNYVVGGLLGPWAMTVKRDVTDPIPRGQFIRWRGRIADVSGCGRFAVGWRKNEAVQALFDDYADLAALGCVAGDVKRETIVGGAATVVVDTTLNWADGEVHEILVICEGNGKVKFVYDGAAPSSGAAYQFTEDLVVVPFMYFIQATTLPGKVTTKILECGPLEHLA